MLFLCLIIICLYLNKFTLGFTPKIVWGHSAVLADSRIYITGGLIPQNQNSFDGEHSKEFYYLDVEKPFGVEAEDKLPWVDLSPVSQILPTHLWSAFSNCGNDSLILYIGEYGGPVTDVYTYNSQQWNNLMTTNPPRSNFHSQTQTVCDVKTGKMYRFGGNLYVSDEETLINNNMDILDTYTRVWEIGGTINAPEGRYDHSGTLLPSGYIVYIGGKVKSASIVNGVLVDMSKLLLYNTNNDTWTSMNTTGYLPTPRAYHSTVLTQDGRIIVYGGYTFDGSAAKDDLVVLDTSQAVYTWSKANVSTNSPLPRFYHTATLVSDYMIVIFGKNRIPTSNEVFILDTSDKSNYKWVSKFVPKTIPSTPPIAPDLNLSTQNRNLGIIISIVLALIGVLFLIYFYRKRRLSSSRFVHFPQIN